MKFIKVDGRARQLMAEHHEVKFYEMVLCFALEELYDDEKPAEEEIPITEIQYKSLLNNMTDYLSNDFHESPWHVADAFVNLIREHGIEKVLADYDNYGDMLEKELENM